MTGHADGSIPHSVLDTRGLPGKQAFELWQEHKGLHYDLRAQKEHAHAFDVRVDCWHLGNVLLANFRLPAQDYSRSRACIGRDGTDVYMLQIIHKGWSGSRDTGAPARAGDIVIYDMAQPSAARGGDSEVFSLVLPRNLLAPHLKAPDEHSLRQLAASNPLTSLLGTHLMELRAHLPKMSQDQAQAVMPATVQLVAAALNGTAREQQAGSVRMAMTERICTYINAHILDPDLNPDSIAGRFGMTRRNLGYLFESYGGVAAYVRRKRLSSIRAVLTDPARKGASIETIAEAHGFNHYRSFALAFQRQFGLTPREVRALAHEGQTVPLVADSKLAEWTHWIRDLK